MVKNTTILRKHGTLFQSDTYNTDGLISPAYNLLNSKTSIPNVSVKGRQKMSTVDAIMQKNIFRLLSCIYLPKNASKVDANAIVFP